MLKAALKGFGISIVLWLIPIVHFVGGPLGPFIGGFVGGSMVQAKPRKAAGVGLLMGLFMGGPALILVLVSILASGLFSDFVQRLLLFVGIGLVFYTGLLGTLGALAGGWSARKAMEKETAAQESGGS